MVEQWGVVPLAYLAQFANCEYTYGYIGSEDLTMYPLLPPGTFIQVDESKKTWFRRVAGDRNMSGRCTSWKPDRATSAPGAH